jgi:hypothetical protein
MHKGRVKIHRQQSNPNFAGDDGQRNDRRHSASEKIAPV